MALANSRSLPSLLSPSCILSIAASFQTAFERHDTTPHAALRHSATYSHEDEQPVMRARGLLGRPSTAMSSPIICTLDDSTFSRNNMADMEIDMTPLCRKINGDDTNIQVDIQPVEIDSGRVLEVIVEENTSTSCAEPFTIDREAMMEPIRKDGSSLFLAVDSEVMH